MNDTNKPVSKVLVLEHCPESLEILRQFCDTQGLIGVKVNPDHVMKVLASTLDLGAILLSEGYAGGLDKTLELGRYIRTTRPELPLFIRQENAAVLPEKPGLSQLATTLYTRTDLKPLQDALDKYLFTLLYPDSLITGIAELSLAALAHQFPQYKASNSVPYVVRDRIIFGEVFTLIPLESSWFKGYMLLQTEEASILSLAPRDASASVQDKTNFRLVNNLLSEITNLIWGAFKNRYIPVDDPGCNAMAQVPIVINHAHHYISFGSDHPHLCFQYSLSNDEGTVLARFQQWFIFNLNWSPDQYREIPENMAEMVESGELELF